MTREQEEDEYEPTSTRLQGEVVAKIRRACEMSPEEFATKLHITTAELLGIEAGRICVPARFDTEVYDIMDDRMDEMGFCD